MTDIPPAPRDPNAPLVTTEGLKPGDVVQIAVQLTDRATGQPFWWKRFACVRRVRSRRIFTALTLKMKPDADNDIRDIDLSERFEQQVVTHLPERLWPQGVIAMRMKAIVMGWIKLDHSAG